MCFDTSEQASQVLGEVRAEHDFLGKMAVATATALVELLQPGDSVRFQNIERNVALVIVSLSQEPRLTALRLGSEPLDIDYVSVEEAAALIADFLE